MVTTNKHIHQLLDAQGKPVAAATSAPGWCVHDGVPLSYFPDRPFGKIFSEPTSGNNVDFYVTGQEYFSHLAGAIKQAKRAIFITGWQVNFDVQLVTETTSEKDWKGTSKKVTKWKTLFECLEEAIEANDDLQVFVMPWLSPKVGVDTGDFETMLAVFQLNAGKSGRKRAFALPAVAQSDMLGGLGIAFSHHHQKLIVIDHARAFVGGIDVAYGRRDDGKFSLAHDGREGNELYNSCVPPINDLSNLDQVDLLTRGELLAACFEGNVAGLAQWWYSRSGTVIAGAMDAGAFVGGLKKDAAKYLDDWWTQSDITPDFVHRMQDVPIDIAQNASRWFYHELDNYAKGELEKLRKKKGDQIADIVAAVITWLNGKSMEDLKPEIRSGTVEVIEALMIATLGILSDVSNDKLERYTHLRERKKMVPAGGKVISDAQPRMPWHDVHSSITGPAASDLSRNFVRRWNAISDRYRKSYADTMKVSGFADLLTTIGLKRLATIDPVRLVQPPPTTKQPISGKAWVQVLRSAPVTMLKDEIAANDAAATPAPAHAQDNCLKAMLNAIAGAQKFVYIEGQFFQSEYGIDLPKNAPLSGPMAALTDLKASPGYMKYARQLEIFGVPPQEIPARLRWSQVDDVMRDVKGKGADFMHDLFCVLKNFESVKATTVLGASQKALLNPLGEALARKIERQIFDGKPFHAYLVLPVHPEGTLDTLNIMNQVHLTMQSLVFGRDSLINRVSRALLVTELRTNKKFSLAKAIAEVAKLGPAEVAESVGTDWKRYLTLLNLRNWDVLKGRPVTEQIYVHSKLLIADDRVAILGSANINDRSQLGNRDSELAVVVWGEDEVVKKLDGTVDDFVSANIHKLRVRLWTKLFGMSGGASPALSLKAVLDKPAAPATWQAIQAVADANAAAYETAFPFLPSSTESTSIWPTWDSKKHRLKHHMPFNERFWRDDSIHDEHYTWDAASRAKEIAPKGVHGFIVAMPTSWTMGESNVSGMNNFVLAQNSPAREMSPVESKQDTRYAAITPTVSAEVG